MKTRSFAILIALVFSINSVMNAQSSQRDWGTVERIATGTDLFVTTRDGKTINGSLRRVDGQTIELGTNRSIENINRSDVKTLHLAAAKSNKRGKIIGAAVGLFAGAFVGGMINRNAVYEEDYNYTVPILVTIGGTVGGGVVGGKIAKGKKKGELIYRSP